MASINDCVNLLGKGVNLFQDCLTINQFQENNNTKPILKFETNKAAGVHVTIILDSCVLLFAIFFYCLCLRRLRIFKKGGYYSKKKSRNSEEITSFIKTEDGGDSTLANPIDRERLDSYDQVTFDSKHIDSLKRKSTLGNNEFISSGIGSTSIDYENDQIEITPVSRETEEQQEEEISHGSDTFGSEDSNSPMIPKKKKNKNILLRFFEYIWGSIWYEQQYHSFGAFYGHQVTLYLFLSKQIIIALGICSFLSVLVLLPIHITGNTPNIVSRDAFGNVEVVKENYFLVYTTISMVANSPYKLYVHVALSLAYILTVLLFLRRFTESKLVKQYPIEGKRLISQYSARLDGLPINLLSNDLLMKACNLPDIFNGTVSNSRISYATADRIDLEKKYAEVCRKLKHFELIQSKKKKRPFMCLCLRGSSCCRLRTDAISYFEKKKQKLEKKMKKWDDKFYKNPKGTGRAYLLFNSTEARKWAIKKGGRGVYLFSIDLEGKKPSKIDNISFTVTGAAEPSDILWENSSISNEWRFVRLVAINFLIIIYLMIFTSPLTLLTSLQSIILYLPTNIHSIVDGIRSISGPIGDLVYQYLPSLLLLIVSNTLPYVIPFLTKLERHYTFSQYSFGTITRLYLYLLLTSFILPTLALTSIDGIFQYLQFRDISQTMKQLFLPGNGVFFVNYTIQYLFWGVIIDLLRITDVFRYIIKSIGAVGEQEKRLAAQVAEFDFPLEYGYLLSFFAIVFSYSIFSPIIICLGFIYFIFKYRLDTRNIIFLCSKNKNSRHNVLPDVTNYRKNIMALTYIIFSVVLLFELVQIMFYLREREACYIHLTIMITSFIATLIYVIYWGLTYSINPHKNWNKQNQFTENLLDTENSEIHVLEASDQDMFDIAYLPPFSKNYELSIETIELDDSENKPIKFISQDKNPQNNTTNNDINFFKDEETETEPIDSLVTLNESVSVEINSDGIRKYFEDEETDNSNQEKKWIDDFSSNF